MAVGALRVNGVSDNPYGPNGPYHNITQTFTWTENNPANGRGRRAFLASALTFSCLRGHVTSERFIVGTYRAEAPRVTITLGLDRDHSFVQSVRTNVGRDKAAN